MSGCNGGEEGGGNERVAARAEDLGRRMDGGRRSGGGGGCGGRRPCDEEAKEGKRDGKDVEGTVAAKVHSFLQCIGKSRIAD